MKKLTTLLALTFLAFGIASCGTTSKMTSEQQQAIKSAIANRNFKINVERAYPLGASMVNLTSPYDLTVKGDSVRSYLPYFGQAYNIPYGGGVGLNFDGIMTDYTQEQDKKGNEIISFKVKSPDDLLGYQLEISDSGYASIQVDAQNRQSIRFEGRIEMKE